MPTQFSSSHSVDDSVALAKNLGIRCLNIPIQQSFEAFKAQMAPTFSGLAEDTTEENMQARLRGLTLMSLSNKSGSLLLTTGNKSELAVGYCTLYGDMCGGLAVISDVPKTMVYRLSQYINREREIIPWNTIEKPPSAELRSRPRRPGHPAALRHPRRNPAPLRGGKPLRRRDRREGIRKRHRPLGHPPR